MIAVVIPSYRVRGAVLALLERIGDEVDRIYVVDDACPENTGKLVEEQCRDPRVTVLYRDDNGGVGAATMTGYRAAIASGADIIVKIDGDGQMPPEAIMQLIGPILRGDADYVKGNRFYDLETLGTMPAIRLLGNAALSFLNKVSSGYWNLFDPTNGFTAIHGRVAAELPMDKISHGYFFESDLLFRLNTMRAVVCDVPMQAHYGAERSNLVVRRTVTEFAWKHVRNIAKRLFYKYFLRDFNAASIELLLGVPLVCFGGISGGIWWWRSIATGIPATSGTVMLAALPIVVGTQLLTAFVIHDVQDLPSQPLHRMASSPQHVIRQP